MSMNINEPGADYEALRIDLFLSLADDRAGGGNLAVLDRDITDV
jgi:hypothetical protein